MKKFNRIFSFFIVATLAFTSNLFLMKREAKKIKLSNNKVIQTQPVPGLKTAENAASYFEKHPGAINEINDPFEKNLPNDMVFAIFSFLHLPELFNFETVNKDSNNAAEYYICRINDGRPFYLRLIKINLFMSETSWQKINQTFRLNISGDDFLDKEKTKVVWQDSENFRKFCERTCHRLFLYIAIEYLTDEWLEAFSSIKGIDKKVISLDIKPYTPYTIGLTSEDDAVSTLVTEAGVRQLQKLRNLETLSISNRPYISTAWGKQLEKLFSPKEFPKLKKLEFEAFAKIPNLLHLKDLQEIAIKISSSPLNNSTLENLPKSIRCLKLVSQAKLGVNSLEKFSELEDLDVKNINNGEIEYPIRSNNLKSLKKLKKLKGICINNDEEAKNLPESIEVMACLLPPYSLSNGFSHLKNLRQLDLDTRQLALDTAESSKQSASFFASLPSSLKSLGGTINIANDEVAKALPGQITKLTVKITAPLSDGFSHLKNLLSLCVTHDSTQQPISFFKSLPSSLKDLSIDNIDTDEKLKSLPEFIEDLDVSLTCPLSYGFSHLKNLQYLTIHGGYDLYKSPPIPLSFFTGLPHSLNQLRLLNILIDTDEKAKALPEYIEHMEIPLPCISYGFSHLKNLRYLRAYYVENIPSGRILCTFLNSLPHSLEELEMSGNDRPEEFHDREEIQAYIKHVTTSQEID